MSKHCPFCGKQQNTGVLYAVRELLSNHAEWTTTELKRQLCDVSTKEIYNALGYLTRKRQVTRIGYGRYKKEGGDATCPLPSPSMSEAAPVDEAGAVCTWPRCNCPSIDADGYGERRQCRNRLSAQEDK